MKKLGVIGGMGPEATAYCYEQIIRHTDAARDQDHLDMVILSCASMPDRTEAIRSGDTGRLLGLMCSCAGTLERLGCSNIAIPCNTSHYCYDQIQASTPVPIIHMPREAVRYAAARAMLGVGSFDPAATADAAAAALPSPVRRIGIMGTDGTIMSGVYDRECRAAGIEPVALSAERQADVTALIYEDVKGGRRPDLARFDRVMAAFVEQGCDRVILACTELSVLQRFRAMPPIVLDAMDVLVRESIIRSNAGYRP